VIGREHELELMNRKALQIARQVADQTGKLMAGNICNSTIFDKNDRTNDSKIKEMYKESLQWAVAEGCDFVIAETIGDYLEAKIALECIRQYAPGREAVIMMAQDDVKNRKTACGMLLSEALHKLEQQGADVVGLNCSCGPEIQMELMKDIRKVCKGHLAALPVPYRTNWQRPKMQNLIVEKTGERAFPYSLDAFLCSVDEVREFGAACVENDIKFVGFCCGNSARYTRNLAESIGRKPPSSRYSPNMDLHYIFGTDKSKLHECNLETLRTITDAQGNVKPQDQHKVKK